MRLDTKLSRLIPGSALAIGDDCMVEAKKTTGSGNFICSRCCFLEQEGETGCTMTRACFASERKDGESVYFTKRKKYKYEK